MGSTPGKAAHNAYCEFDDWGPRDCPRCGGSDGAHVPGCPNEVR